MRKLLLIGGTSDSVSLARALVEAGYETMASQATEAVLDYPVQVAVRRGRLDCDGFCRLVHAERIEAIVDAAHPFATALHDTVREVAGICGIPLLRLEREASALPSWVHLVDGPEAAAELAFELGDTVLVTTGSRTLEAYAARAREVGGTLWARMLPCEESRAVAERCGLPEDRIAWGRGPFATEDTLELLRRSGAWVLVAKDSGEAGGLGERLEAAAIHGAKVVAIRRPARLLGAVESVEEMLACLARLGEGT